MSSTTQTILLWLFIINLGIAFGAGLFEHRIVVPRWLRSSPESGAHWNAEAVRADDTGRRFWAFVTTVPLTLLALAERIFTLSYFIPTMIGLMNAEDSPAAVDVATRWSRLNYLRHALGLIAWLLSLRTLEVLAQSG